MQRRIGVALAWLAATAVSIVIATAAVGAVRVRVTDPPPALAAPSTTAAGSTTTTDAAPTTTAASPAASSSTTSTPTSGGSTSTTAPSSSTTSTTATTTTDAVPVQIKTYATIGGSVTIEVSSSGLRLLGATPNSGFTVSETESSPTRIEIEFRSGDHESQFRAELEGGELDVRVDEEGDD